MRAHRAAAWLGALALSAAACSKAPPAPPAPNALQKTVAGLTSTPPCSRQVSRELSPSYPLPALKDGALVYKAFFFGWEGNPKKGVKLHRAEGDAVFTANGRILLCQERPGQAAAFPDRPGPGSAQEQEQAQRRLYELTEAAAALYAAGRPADAAGRQALADFSSAFAQLALPEHVPDYLALSPEFWDWARANGGRSPAP